MVQRLLLLARPGPIIAHWVTSQWDLPETWEWTFPAPWDTVGMKCPPNMVKYAAMKGPCWLEVGACQLSLQRLHHDHSKLLTFNTPWKEFRVEIRNKALSALGKTRKNWPSESQMLSGKGFSEHKFLHLLSPREALMSQTNLVLVLLASPRAAFLLLLIFGPYIFKFLIKLVSSRMQQISKW